MGDGATGHRCNQHRGVVVHILASHCLLGLIEELVNGHAIVNGVTDGLAESNELRVASAVGATRGIRIDEVQVVSAPAVGLLGLVFRPLCRVPSSDGEAEDDSQGNAEDDEGTCNEVSVLVGFHVYSFVHCAYLLDWQSSEQLGDLTI